MCKRSGTHPFQQRLAFEELLAHQLSLRELRHRHQLKQAPGMKVPGKLSQSFLATLPFTLTAAQQRVVTEITHDLNREHPMQRLAQGDVGSGKTVVAALATTQAVEAGYQVAIMAPTELLAEQHRVNFTQWLAPLGVSVTWLSGKIKGKTRQQALVA
ncbi:MAG: ATP-dependent DNA helicase RecG, partial [Oceanobacter sp.]